MKVVITNRRARHLAGPTSPLLDELRRPRAGVRVVETSSIEGLRAEAERLASARDADLEAVILAGGDGSYMAGVSALARAFGDDALPRLGFAPGGTVCTVARNWGLPSSPRRQLAYVRRLLDPSPEGEAPVVTRPTLRVRTSHVDYTGFIFGAGLVGRFFEVYERRGAGGYLTAARIVLRIFGGSFVGSSFARSVLEPSPCAIDIDGAPAPFDRMSLFCASVVRDLGLHMRLVYRAGEEHERFHVVATPLSTRALGPQMPLVLAGRPLLGPRVDALAAHVAMRFPEEEPGAFVLDGDLFRADAVEITAGPTLSVITPS